MKKKSIFILFILLYPCICLGEIKTVKIDWMVFDSSSIQGYKMYYSYSSDMSGKSFACQTNDPAVTSLTCSGIDITAQPVYFSIGMLTSEGEINSPPIQASSVECSTITSTVQNIQIASIPIDSTVINESINFQPAGSAIPSGFVADSGADYDTNRGYGWISTGAYGAGDRNNSASPDQSYDTVILAKSTAKWEMAVPNGSYTVTVCVGDPTYYYTSHYVSIEGTTFIEGESLSAANRWIERTKTVTISDGKLTASFNRPDSDVTHLCWIKISKSN